MAARLLQNVMCNIGLKIPCQIPPYPGDPQSHDLGWIPRSARPACSESLPFSPRTKRQPITATHESDIPFACRCKFKTRTRLCSLAAFQFPPFSIGRAAFYSKCVSTTTGGCFLQKFEKGGVVKRGRLAAWVTCPSV